ncbi:c-type cytochrome [Acidomonas methanolica]|uniref:Cytochrome c-552 class I n=1 Tax=Acidomonas methanolica NBRC 104435 TaxID=1231351 RepID=A0A023D3Z5_ACIMT|nr:cytochrome c [Acidomonas methanolica]MBU2653717.1 cytochrome c [Acidomonas methanolica]TCS31669.1 cbb3-type cytochrome c oxidase subunit III [Acidomonas methanolica]GAJ28883.1 cytochrome c-552 class I [Acidomonas methanolica NBRC 104435]GBQ54097.1 cytochrome c class I [Acidomonas methanolica]GEK98087.1 hypothetical protein AME01nite_05860 [Acidomonas methanolica NBRC 104435]
MRLPSLDRSLRLPLLLALIMVGGVLTWRLEKNRDVGLRLYEEECSICHHGGSGQAAETPPIFDRLNVIAATPEGRIYLTDVLLNGLSGKIMAAGKPFDWSMPNFRRLSDAELAAILNWVAAQTSSEPQPHFTAQDFAARRTPVRSSELVHAERATLDTAHPLP